MRLKDAAAALGQGLLAGVAGTAVMTLSSTLEMKARGREASDAPAEAAGKVLGIEPESEKGRQRFSTLVHWGYGTAWGGARGLIAALGLRDLRGDVVHFGTVWGAALIMLPALDVAPPASEWGTEEIAIDAFHHAIYAAATGAVLRVLQAQQ